jgi:hypothetical protein
MDKIAIGLAGIAAAIATGFLSQPEFDEMAKEVDRVRAAEAKVLAEAGQFRETVPTELAKALLAAVPDKRLLNGEACKVVDGRVFCQVENGNEVQFPASKTALLQPEVDAIKAEYEAAVAAKAAALAAEEEAARLAAGAIEKP